MPNDLSNEELQRARLDNLFDHHPPTPLQQLQYAEIRKAAKAFAKVLLANTPACPDQEEMMLRLRGVVHIANGSIATHGDSSF
jgi:hypothetical protein